MNLPPEPNQMGSPTTPSVTAQALAALHPNWRWWKGDVYEWNGHHYELIPRNDLHKLLREILSHHTYQRAGSDKLVAWDPVKRQLDEIVLALNLPMGISDNVADGAWLKTGERDFWYPFSNCLFHPDQGHKPSDADYWCTWGMSFEYDEDAKCPQWLGFLSTLGWQRDSIGLLQEWVGYLISGRTDLQKFMFFNGLPGSGKGTIVRVLEQLLGGIHRTVPTTLKEFSGDFGLHSLKDKSHVFMSEAQNNRHIDMNLVVERLKDITGEDSLPITRKHHDDDPSVRLPTRITITANSMLWFKDAAGALERRLLLLSFDRSFIGKEDPMMTTKLLRELPGIFQWALDGLDRLNERGKFSHSRASQDRILDFKIEASPVKAFVDNCCEVGDNQKYGKSLFRQDMRRWLREQGAADKMPISDKAVTTQLKEAFKIRDRNIKVAIGTKRVEAYGGIGPKP